MTLVNLRTVQTGGLGNVLAETPERLAGEGFSLKFAANLIHSHSAGNRSWNTEVHKKCPMHKIFPTPLTDPSNCGMNIPLCPHAFFKTIISLNENKMMFSIIHKV
jgi:hypothetical protein